MEWYYDSGDQCSLINGNKYCRPIQILNNHVNNTYIKSYRLLECNYYYFVSATGMQLTACIVCKKITKTENLCSVRYRFNIPIGRERCNKHALACLSDRQCMVISYPFPFSTFTLLAGWDQGNRPAKNLCHLSPTVLSQNMGTKLTRIQGCRPKTRQEWPVRFSQIQRQSSKWGCWYLHCLSCG